MWMIGDPVFDTSGRYKGGDDRLTDIGVLNIRRPEFASWALRTRLSGLLFSNQRTSSHV